MLHTYKKYAILSIVKSDKQNPLLKQQGCSDMVRMTKGCQTNPRAIKLSEQINLIVYPQLNLNSYYVKYNKTQLFMT